MFFRKMFSMFSNENKCPQHKQMGVANIYQYNICLNITTRNAFIF